MLLPRRFRRGSAGSAKNRPIVYILSNVAIGAGIGVVIAALLMLTNAAGLGSLIHDSSDPVTPVLLVLMGFATLFGGLYTAAAIMMMPREDED